MWDFEHAAADQYPLFQHFPYFDLYRKQVVKQADLVLAMLLHGSAFTADRSAQLRILRTTHGARLFAIGMPQVVIAAEVGQLDLAYDYLYEAALWTSMTWNTI